MSVLIGVAIVSAAGWLAAAAAPRSAAVRHCLLTAALLACLGWPLVAAVRAATTWTVLSIPHAMPPAGSDTNINPARDPRPPHTASRDAPPEDAGPLPNNAPTTAPVAESKSPPSREVTPLGHAQDEQTSSHVLPRSGWTERATGIFTVIYVVVAGGLLVRIAGGLVLLRRLKRRARPTGLVADGIPVREADVPVPAAAGFGTPAILLPPGLIAALGPAALGDVLAHEAAHLRRRDHRVLLLQRLAEAVYWPVPTVHLLNRALAAAREELCDNAALSGRDPVEYGRTLLAVAARARPSRRAALALASPALGRGALETRVARLLDGRRDRRTGVGRPTRWGVAAGLVAAGLLVGTTRVTAVADPPPAVADPPPADASAVVATPATVPAPAPAAITWTGEPVVDRQDATLHRGVVLDPDGKPLAGASIYAASTIELLDMGRGEDVDIASLGPVRAVTDGRGRFEFRAEDLTWVTPAGERKRWEALLVATKAGLPSAWLKTWGEDRTFRSHRHPWVSRPVVLRTRPPAALTGRVTLDGGGPLAGAAVRVTGLMAPVGYDLTRHIAEEEQTEPGLFSGIDYAETLHRPRLLPGLRLEAKTDDAGRFELPGLPEGFLANLTVAHPRAATTDLRAAVRAIEPVFRRGSFPPHDLAPEPTLYGDGLTVALRPGVTLEGTLRAGWLTDARAGGVTVALANHNDPTGMTGERFTSDAQGRFAVTGLSPRPDGYILAFVGSFDAPFAGRRERVFAGRPALVELAPAVPYRLTVTDPAGNPVDRTVYSLPVQVRPGEFRSGVTERFDTAERTGPGRYRGIVPAGPAAVFVARGAKTDRPAAVDPKAFFAPGRTDWAADELRNAYGDAWRVAAPHVAVHDGLAANGPGPQDQVDSAAIVLTDAQPRGGVLELRATVFTDPPVAVALVDEAGGPVAGASVTRQFARYDAENLPAAFPLHGLHPDRAEVVLFAEPARGLIASARLTSAGGPRRIVLRPAARLRGRVVTAAGEPAAEFGVAVRGPAVLPGTFVVGRASERAGADPAAGGGFDLVVPPGAEVRGEFFRRTGDWRDRPPAGPAFGPVTPEPGSTHELGDLVVP